MTWKNALCSCLFVATLMAPGCRKDPDADAPEAESPAPGVAWSDSVTLVLSESPTAAFWAPSDLVIGCDDGVARVISSMLCEDGTEWVWDREKGTAVRK